MYIASVGKLELTDLHVNKYGWAAMSLWVVVATFGINAALKAIF